MSSSIDYSEMLMSNKDNLKEYIQIYLGTKLPIQIDSVYRLYADMKSVVPSDLKDAFLYFDYLYTIGYTLYNISNTIDIRINEYLDWVASKRNDKIDGIIS